VRSLADKEALAEQESYSDFHPRFTYPVRLSSYVGVSFLTFFRFVAWLQIFGEDEKIYGYKGLTIDVSLLLTLLVSI
jgi:histone acetyltransferase 1